MKKISSVIFILILLFTTSCNKKENPKNVILMIGDGMGPGQISLLYYYLKHTKNEAMKNVRFSFENTSSKQIGISSTGPHGNIVVDSACSATQLATGIPARSEMIGLDKDGEVAKTILEKAQERGLKTGLVSDTRLTHATPASFASHVSNRWSEDQIAAGMIEVAPDLLFSGGASRFVPKGTKQNISKKFKLTSKRKDDRNLLNEAREKGYQVIHSRSELASMDTNKKVLGLFTNKDIPDAMWFRDNKDDPNREIPSLLEMSQAAIGKLSKGKKGFFLMIEGGQIDWAAHQNDAGSMLHEMLSFNETINWVIDWVKENPDTLLVITADHETGGFGLGYNIGKISSPIQLSGSKFKNSEYRTLINYGDVSSLDIIYSQKKSLDNLWNDFHMLEESKQTANSLCGLIKDITSVALKSHKCDEILKRSIIEENRRKNLNLYKGEVPEFLGYDDHYYYELDKIRTTMVARAIADKQNVVWGTSGHTASPVHVYSLGEEHWTSEFSGQLTHPEIGKKLQQALGL